MGGEGEAPRWQERAAAVVEQGQPPVRLPAPLLHEIYQHAIECYPEEACGLLLGPPASPPLRVERCTNVQNRRKAEGLSELDARHGYWIDERELLLALREADDLGHELRLIYHSHVDTAAYFSHADLESAVGPNGTPLYPGVGQLVVSVYEDGVRDTACFVWDEERTAFVGRGIEQTSD